MRLDHLLSKEHFWNAARVNWLCRARCWVSEGTGLRLSFGMPAPVNFTESVRVMGGWSLFENCTVDASICGQVFKGARWMPWHQGHGLSPTAEHIGSVEGTRGSETSQYPQEEKTTVIPGVVASETG